MGIFVRSGILGGEMVAHRPGMPEMWVRGPALGTIFPIFITPMTLVSMTMILYKLRAEWLLNLPLKDLQFQGDECSSLH